MNNKDLSYLITDSSDSRAHCSGNTTLTGSALTQPCVAVWSQSTNHLNNSDWLASQTELTSQQLGSKVMHFKGAGIAQWLARWTGD